MPLPALSDTQEKVERSVFEVLRLALVEYGYLPDVTTFPNNAAGESAYNAAKKSIKTSKGFCIELFGVGSQKDKYLKKVPRIVISRRRFSPSSEIGAPSNYYFESGGTLSDGTQKNYIKKRGINNILEGYYDIIISNSQAKADRVMNAIAHQVLPGIGYIPYHGNTADGKVNERFFMDFVGQYENHDDEDGVHNYFLTYRIPDLCLFNPITIDSDTAPIKCITLDTLSASGSNLSTLTGGNCLFDFHEDDFDEEDFFTP